MEYPPPPPPEEQKPVVFRAGTPTTTDSRGGVQPRQEWLTTPKLISRIRNLISRGPSKEDDILGRTPKADYDEVVDDIIKRRPEEAEELSKQLSAIYPTSGKMNFKKWGDLLRTRNLAKHRSKLLRDKRKKLKSVASQPKIDPDILFHWGTMLMMARKESTDFSDANPRNVGRQDESPMPDEDFMDWNSFL